MLVDLEQWDLSGLEVDGLLSSMGEKNSGALDTRILLLRILLCERTNENVLVLGHAFSNFFLTL